MERPVRRPAEPSFSGVFSRTFLVALLTSVLVLLVARRWLGGSLLVPDADARVISPRGDLAADERTTIELFETAVPSVVHIETRSIRTQRTLLRSRSVEVPEGSGSGFLWDSDGHVVTNFHVIRTASAADVTLHDGSVYSARLVGTAPDFDLAVLRIEAPPGKLPPIPLGSSGDLRVGQKVLAIGNPYGLEGTLTTGVISGLDRTIVAVTDLAIHGVIQTDAAINPGNSGGPLLDSAGRLIGINTAIKSPTGSYAGIGFAVPVDTINHVVPRILREGFAPRAGLGITLGPDDWASEHGLEGAVVERVLRGGAADRAGLQPIVRISENRYALGDVVVELDGRPVRGQQDLLTLLEAYEAGDVVRVGVARPVDGRVEELELDVRLQELR